MSPLSIKSIIDGGCIAPVRVGRTWGGVVYVGNTDFIAVDGPVASGKTAVGRMLAHKLGYRFLDTGAMYRAIAWAALEAGVSTTDGPGLVRLVQEHMMELVFQEDGQAVVLVDQQDVSPYLWQRNVEQQVSLVAQVAGVREVMVALQRSVAQDGPVVMAGRDIGTVVLPDAHLKVFLTASDAERARRRHVELQALGQDAPYQQVLEEIEQRDGLDSRRKIAPLRPARDAHVIITDDRSVEVVVEQILKLVGQQ